MSKSLSDQPELVDAAMELSRPVEAPLRVIESPVERMITVGMERGLNAESLAKLYDLYKEERADQRRAAFFGAFAAFKAECPPIVKRHENDQFKVTRNGVKVNRPYADLDDIASTVQPVLAKHGLAFKFGDMVVNGDMVTVFCVLSHRDGHTEQTPATGPHASTAGCSPLQKMGTAYAYLQRYALIAALGITSCDDDNDGNAEPGDLQTITPEQVRQIEDMMAAAEVPISMIRFTYGAQRVSDLRAELFGPVMDVLEAKMKAKK